MQNNNRRAGAWFASLVLSLAAGANVVYATESDTAKTPEEAFMNGPAPGVPGAVTLASVPASVPASMPVAAPLAPAAAAAAVPATASLTDGATPSSLPGETAPVSGPDKLHTLTERALEMLGVRYKRGGESATHGVDCSGLVRLVFKDALGIDLPHHAADMSRLGEPVAKSDLQPGDLLFFRTVKRTISHVGIYLGEGQFIHAPHKGAPVRVEQFDGYWIKRFASAKRVTE